MAREQELQRRDVPAARLQGERPAAEPWPPAAAERAAGPRTGDAVDREALARLHAADARARRGTGDAVDAARVDVHRAQRDLQRGDVGGRSRRGGRGGDRADREGDHARGDEGPATGGA